jgi:hypothetical protein
VPKSFAQLKGSLSGFASFAITFAALAVLWAVHDRFFRRTGLDDAVTRVLNTVLLFMVLVFVFPLKYLAGMSLAALGVPTGVETVRGLGELAQLFMLYGAAWTAVFAALAGMYAHAARRGPAIGLSEDEAWDCGSWARHYGGFAVVGLVSVALAAAHVGLSFGLPGVAYALVGPVVTVSWKQRGGRRVR